MSRKDAAFVCALIVAAIVLLAMWSELKSAQANEAVAWAKLECVQGQIQPLKTQIDELISRVGEGVSKASQDYANEAYGQGYLKAQLDARQSSAKNRHRQGE